MRHRTALAVGLLFLTVATPVFAAIEYEFRQTVRSDIKSVPPQDISAKAMLDADRSRVEFISGSRLKPGTYIISDNGRRVSYVVYPQSKTFTEVDLGSVVSALGSGKVEITNLKSSVAKLDDRPLIAGYPTEHYRIELSYDIALSIGSMRLKQHANTLIDKWVTNAFGDVGQMFLASGITKTGDVAIDQLMEAEAGKVKGFPLRQTLTITTVGMDPAPGSKLTDFRGTRTQTSEMIVTKAAIVVAEPSAFIVPAAFKRVDVNEESQANITTLSLDTETTP